MNDAEIRRLIQTPKVIRKKDAAKLVLPVDKPDSAFWRFDVKMTSQEDCSFHIRGRLSADDPTDFSVILSMENTSGSDFILMRCNGPHEHHNYIERTRISGTHIHIATERYAELGRKNEGFAELTDEYTNFEGALYSLIKHCNISIEDDAEQIKIFAEGGVQQ